MVPAIHLGDPDGVPTFCPGPGPAPAVVGIWIVNQQMEGLCLSVFEMEENKN